jgi:hypothetical protein
VARRHVSNRERALKDALKAKDVEALFWWIVQEHKQVLLDGEKSHLSPGLFRLSLEHLSKLHMKRLDQPDSEAVGAELEQLENILTVIK